jgi:hypothetical protein
MRCRHIASGLAVVIAATCGAPVAASASAVASPPRPLAQAAQQQAVLAASTVPWKRYRTKPWQDAPGKVCAFGVNATIVRDGEQYRTLSSYPDGSPQIQEFRGPLVVRYTNTSTGKSVVGNLSGYGWFYYPAGGGFDAYAPSHVGYTVPVGNHGFPAGEWIFSGQLLLIVSSTGAINVVLIHATAENICRTLS